MIKIVGTEGSIFSPDCQFLNILLWISILCELPPNAQPGGCQLVQDLGQQEPANIKRLRTNKYNIKFPSKPYLITGAKFYWDR